MRRTAAEYIRSLEMRVARLERQARSPIDDKHALFIAKSLNKLLKRKGMDTDLVAESGQGIGITIDNSLGDVMPLLKARQLGIKMLNSDTLGYLSSVWKIKVDGEDIHLTMQY